MGTSTSIYSLLGGQIDLSYGGASNSVMISIDNNYLNKAYLHLENNNIIIGATATTITGTLHTSGIIRSVVGFNTNGLSGWSGTFSSDSQVVTVTGGIITSVV